MLLFNDLKSLGVVILAALSLASCGGGGTDIAGGSPKTQSPPQERNAIENYDATSAKQALESLASVEPQFGSVIQFRGENPTTDFDVSQNEDGTYRLSLPRRGGTVILDTPTNDSSTFPRDIGSVGNQDLNGQYFEKLEDVGDTRGGVYIFNPDPDDLGDWLVGGAWILVKSNDNYEYGAFVDGPEIATGRPADFTLPTQGSATYNGKAAGMYDYRLQASPYPRNHIWGQYTGDFEATATFTSNGGTMNGTIKNIILRGMYGNYDPKIYKSELPGLTIQLQEASFGSDGQGIGNVTVSLPGTDFNQNKGKWGNQFSSESTSADDQTPRLIAGTHSAYAETPQEEGVHIGFIGMHIGTYEQE